MLLSVCLFMSTSVLIGTQLPISPCHIVAIFSYFSLSVCPVPIHDNHFRPCIPCLNGGRYVVSNWGPGRSDLRKGFVSAIVFSLVATCLLDWSTTEAISIDFANENHGRKRSCCGGSAERPESLFVRLLMNLTFTRVMYETYIAMVYYKAKRKCVVRTARVGGTVLYTGRLGVRFLQTNFCFAGLARRGIRSKFLRSFSSCHSLLFRCFD